MILQQLINGLTIGSAYALVAIGFTMVFGVLELVNMANGAFYVLGGYLTLIFLTQLQWNFFLALLASMLITGGLGALMDRVALSPIRKRRASKIAALISTVGLGTAVTNFILVFFGTETKRFPDVFNLGKLRLGGIIITWMQIIIFAVTVIMMAVLSLIVYKTKLGMGMRAIAQDADAAKLMGIHTDHIITFTFFIGTMCVGVAGTLVAMYYQQIDTRMAVAVGMKSFAAAVLGGIGILPGAMLGGLLLGVIESLGINYIGSGYGNAISFVMLIVVLIIKPSGLLGRHKVTKV
ncbi:MAG: branched-chain amino acid ABC transporter permease [Oscillospiraceae bacterium]|nr:branched-chain amino acid ABC transporter permease [Oscillospiraceae bacterium]